MLHVLPIAISQREENKKYLQKVAKLKNQSLVDDHIHAAHNEVFEKIDCLECANCCKTTGPLLTDKDIERIAQRLRLKPQQFISQYLRIDEDNDYVFQSMPCPFLGADNYCSIYEFRPKACREYPHTDRAKQKQLFSKTLKNAEMCPAVFHIIEAMKRSLPV